MTESTDENTVGPALFDLHGRVALVTGSTQGLGLTIARGLAQAGAAVIVNGRHAEKVEQTVETLTTEGHEAHGLVMDVTDEDSVTEKLRDLQSTQSVKIDILVNNVGIHQRAPLEEMSTAAWQTVIDANLTSAFLVSREVV